MKNNNPDRKFLIEKQLTKAYGKEVARKYFADGKTSQEIKEYLSSNPNSIERKEKKTSKQKNCCVCGRYIFGRHMKHYIRFGACEKCFYQYIDEREKRWIDGWRPGKVLNE